MISRLRAGLCATAGLPTSHLLAVALALIVLTIAPTGATTARAGDPIRQLQLDAILNGRAEFGHWGADRNNYRAWGTHSNRLISVYTFGTLGAGPGIDLTSYQGERSPYRDQAELERIYGRLPTGTLNPQAEYFDQTNIYDLQKAALDAGRKHIILVVFDGMDWQATWAAAIYLTQSIPYLEGRGTGLHFQDYTANGTTQYGFMCTSPHNEGTQVDVNTQSVLNPNGRGFGGYQVELGGPNPWTPGSDSLYLINQSTTTEFRHAYTDSSSSATSMTAGIKTYNNGVNVDPNGSPVQTIAHQAQQLGYKVGAVSSVPISHATPAAAYAHNVDRDDYQDLTRDMVGLPSIFHPDEPLPGLDVLIGGGFGDRSLFNRAQGQNFVPGNEYITEADLAAIDVANGGRYVVATRQEGRIGKDWLAEQAQAAIAGQHRLFGMFGVGAYKGHLPFCTADRDYRPAPGRSVLPERYSEADLRENPTLAHMTRQALNVLSAEDKPFWLMVEAGDVDWAMHDDNIDNMIGAIQSGNNAVKAITNWVDTHSNWQETVLIVTSDHGHYLQLTQPELLIAAQPATRDDAPMLKKPTRKAAEQPSRRAPRE